MTTGVGDINYKEYSAQKCKIRKQTEKNINGLFERNVISLEQRNTLLQQYLCGEISFGKDGLTEAEARNFTAETFDEIEQSLASNNNQKLRTVYIVQAGDTPKVIAEKFGFTGVEARNFATKIQANAIKDGMWHSYGFMAGDMITIDGDFQEIINQMKAEGTYKDTDQEINDDYLRMRGSNTGAIHKAEEQSEAKKAKNQEQANNIKEESENIANSLKGNATSENKALEKITSKNVVFTLLAYNRKTGHQLARDLINNNAGLTEVGNKICWHLAKRAQELGVSGIYFGDYQKLKNADDLVKWIQNAQEKLYQAEIERNPELKNVSNNTKYKPKGRKDFDLMKADGHKVATELYKQIDGISQSKNTLAALRKINAKNVAFVLTEYKNVKSNTSHRSLFRDIVGEGDINYNFSIADCKNFVCKQLVARAKQLGLTTIDHNQYQNIKDVDELQQWADRVANKIIEVEKSLDADISTKNVERKKKGNYTVKTITNGTCFKEAGLQKIEEKYDENNKLVDKTYYYENGKVVREYTDHTIGKNGKERGRVREVVQQGSVQKPQQSRITEAVPIEIKLPNDASENAKLFAKALQDNKATLMRMLDIDNDTYNKLAKLAMAIAEQETNFGNNGGMYRNGKYEVGRVVSGTVVEKMRDFSYGPTQIKFELQKRDAWIADKFKQLGLTNGEQLYDMVNAAKATMVVLAQTNKIIQNNKNYQNGIQAAQDNIVTIEGWSMEDGHLTKNYNTKPFVNKVTDEDAICYFWNGRGVEVKDGTMEPEALEYTRNVHKYLEKYDIKEDTKARKEAIEKSKREQKVKHDRKTVSNYKPMDNNGPIGSVVFMPKMYTGYSDINDTKQKEAYNVLKTSLANNNKIDENSKKLLLLAVEHNEIGFEFGLLKSEADSLTQRDVDILLKHVSNIKQKINDSGINFSDGVDSREAQIMKSKYLQAIRNEELSFKKEYLASYSPVVETSAVPEKNLLKTPNNNNVSYSEKSSNKRGFVGDVNGAITDRGVNTSNTSKASAALAKAAQKVSNSMSGAGRCMTGFRQALRAAGVDDSDLIEGTPRGAVGFFERHPEMFEEVKFINIGGGKSRQINSTDLPSLPAGYIVIWVPDKSNDDFKNEPGHISITNGNGQAYADETDNLDWGVYHGNTGSGKGEHGTFRVFRLTDKWEVRPDGKLVFNG